MATRPERWAKAVEAMRKGFDELMELREEYGEWRDGLPENLESSAVAEKLDAVGDLDLDSVEGVLDEADGMDVPRGWGRD